MLYQNSYSGPDGRAGATVAASGDRLAWERDGIDWPNREASTFPRAAGLRWHVQRMGRGPQLLLVHGTGSATHSWRGLMPLLARNFTVIAPDLPGHGFTEAPAFDRLSMQGMSDAVAGLLQVLDVAPAVTVGHSAGAAILARMSLSRQIDARALVSLNGALLPFGGIASCLFSPVAKLLARAPVVPALFARRARDRKVVERLLQGTGSRVDPVGVDLYGRLVRNPAHLAAALGMMANWDLHALQRDLAALKPRLFLIAGSNDLTIPAEEAFRARDLVPASTVEILRGLGHLAHEEAAARVADSIERAARSVGVLAPRTDTGW
jgi:magnesium chelatase accessory protein